jgi:hypothetical protein
LPNQDYVEVQMYASGQTFVTASGVSLTAYNASGGLIDTATFTQNLTNGANNSTILIGAAGTVDGVTPDLVSSGLSGIDPAGGAVCWNPQTSEASFADCVSWGNFNDTGSPLPDTTGTPAAAIADGDALIRSIAGGQCPTLLEFGDDTGDSATDFSLTSTLDPRNNAAPVAEMPCSPPDTTITTHPKTKTHDRTPTFGFSATPPAGATFQCKVDDAKFQGCQTPDTLPRLGFGSHTFQVRAKNQYGKDASPAKFAFKVIKKR